MKTFLILISFIFLVNSSSIHQDTPLKIDKDGNIIGLPKKFSPAKFDLEKGYLKIKNKEIYFPSCINYYFGIHENPKLNLSASWYHSKDIMPYYLNFNLSEKNKDYHYSILIDLETLELIYVNASINSGNSTHNHKLELNEYCLKEFNSRIKRLK